MKSNRAVIAHAFVSHAVFGICSFSQPQGTRAVPLRCPLPREYPQQHHRQCRPQTARLVCMGSSHPPAKEASSVPPDTDDLSSTAQYPPEEVFVLEDDYLPEDAHMPIVWTKLPTPSSVIQTSFITDIAIAMSIIAIVYGLVFTTGSLFSATPYATLTIDTALNVLPWYAAQSLTRMIAAYIVSLVFSLGYAYVAYRFKFAAKLLILVIDVLQSIPLLSFLPGLVLGLISIFPGARLGVELAAILLLVTSMAWNMLLGFYQALCCIPSDLLDAAHTFKLSAWKRFWTLELPAGAIGLVWNSVISVAGGWFFLISIESFELGNRDFKLPGLGSFLAVAAERSDYFAIWSGLSVVVLIIVVIDFFVWRPLIAWSAKFTYGMGASSDEDRHKSTVLNAFQRSPLIRSVHTSFFGPAWDSFVNLRFRNPFTGDLIVPDDSLANVQQSEPSVAPSSNAVSTANVDPTEQGSFNALRKRLFSVGAVLPLLIRASLLLVVGFGVVQAVHLVQGIGPETWFSIGAAAAATFARVFVALVLSLLWTVPAGVAIGRNAKLSTVIQPVVQIAASVPATALFPFLLLFLARLGGGLEVGSIALMMLGTMWYILFNVIAGAQAIPDELFDVDSIYNKEGNMKRWRNLILPGIFPYLITGIVTAVGGAWNASIVSEYVVFQGGVLKTQGLGALISEAAASGNYAVLLASTVVMSLLVLLTNRLVWTPLYRLAETKYRTQ